MILYFIFFFIPEYNDLIFLDRIIDLKISTLENNVDDILWFNQHLLPNNKSKIKKTEIYLDLSNSFEDIRSNFRKR